MKKRDLAVVIITILGAALFLVIYNIANNKSITNNDILKISYSSSGGLMSYSDYLACPNIEISNDLTVTLKPGSGEEKDYNFKTYKISEENFKNIASALKEYNFMSLPSNIEEKGCMDGGSATINVTTKEKEKKVHIYCRQNDRFDKVREAIIKNIDEKKEYTNYYKEIRETYKER